MPEGDTIHKTASRLRPVLNNKVLARFEARRLLNNGPSAGTTIGEVEAVGKYLLVHFGDGTTLETHMKMNGSWHIYKAGQRWRRSPGSARVVIETTEGWTAVCFSANHVKILDRSAGPEHLGPDLCSEAPDIEAAVSMFATSRVGTPIAVVLLDQRVCCGVGNVYKSEVLFACAIHPDQPVEAVSEAQRRLIVETAHRMLRANLGPGPRTTVRQGLAVYGRKGLPCLRCGETVRYGRHGEHSRSTYWCPSCQRRRPQTEF